MGRKIAAQAQEEQEVCISARESFELVRCLLRVSIYHVSFLRGLFPDNMFSAATMSNLGNVTVQMLGGEGVQLSSDAQQLKDWVEKGVVDSIRQRYLKKMYFGIAADPECTNILEEFVFTFAYGPEGGETTMQLDANAGGSARATINNLGGGAGAKAGGGKLISIKHVKNQIFRLMRTLVELCGTLEDVPEERHIFMRLTYNEDVPEDYEPPHFTSATEAQASGSFAAQPFSMKAGSLSTEHHRVSVRVKSLLDAIDDNAHADEDDGPAPAGAANNGGAGGGAAAGNAADGGGAADFKGDEGDEGGAAVEWGGDAAAGSDAAAAAADAQRGIKREEARAAPAGGAGNGLGPSQEVDGPAGSPLADGSPASGHDYHLPAEPSAGHAYAQEGDTDMADAAEAHDQHQGGTGTQAGDDEELVQLTLAPPAGLDAAMEELALGGDGAEPKGPAAPRGRAAVSAASAPSASFGDSQLSQPGAAALERVRSYVLTRVARAGRVHVMDVASNFCMVSNAALAHVFEQLVAENAVQQVSADEYARAGAGDSDEGADGGGRRGGGKGGKGANSAAMMPPPAPVTTTRRGGKRLPDAPRSPAPGAAAAAAEELPAAGGGGEAAFDPDCGGAAGDAGHHVFDSSQQSRRGDAGGKRRKTSITAAPISQGGVPGGVPGDSAMTTPNGSGNKGRGRLAAMRRR